ncbi:imidazole glycerol phosphate synthase subunit HisF [Flavobacterium psychrotrophum]|uniref:imidazole glycerol phosphate synthase subunit HisF n=1 Tax=Flavobacterium psychrotrophum TaxID=2294119 RepID=UPI000E31199B|nr:imidazole glycerol phosphate synthase subunit HisF [Flavobacterium psychrotrophum]
MLKKRIIPCLDIKDGRVVKGVNFLGLADAGDPVALAARYAAEGADELVFLDIAATIEKRKTLSALVTQVAATINIPFTVGGGINTAADAEYLVRSGADKVSVNSSAVKNPKLISEISNNLGCQAVVVAIDAKKVDNAWEVFINGGNTATGVLVTDWAKQAEQLGAGEILLTSMDKDGTKSGFAVELLNQVCAVTSLPVIASGGAGSKEHFRDVFTHTGVGAALAASLFHYGELGIQELKDYLKQQNIPIR